MEKVVVKISDVTQNDMTQMRKNSDDSLKMFEAMIVSLKNIESANNKTSSTPSAVPNRDTNETPAKPDIPIRKGIIFLLLHVPQLGCQEVQGRA